MLYSFIFKTLLLLRFTTLAQQFVLSTSPLIIKPISPNPSLKNLTLIIIQGAGLESASYVSLAEEIVKKNCFYNIYVGIPSFLENMPNPLEIKSKIDETLLKLSQEGVSNDEVFLMGHSVGTVMLQMFTQDSSAIEKRNIRGIILLGGFILRKYIKINDNGKSEFVLNLPTLSVGAELDGLSRITRLAESFWHLKNNTLAQEDIVRKFPHVVIRGMNHSQFANGNTTAFLIKYDLKPEISNTLAVENTAEIVNAFFASFYEKKNNDVLSKWVENSESFLKIFLETMELEGNMNLKPPCFGHDLVNVEDPRCFHGSPISNLAQKLMANLSDNFSIENDDNFHRVASIMPVHLPIIENKCDFSQKEKCVLKSITVSEPVNCTSDYLDTGFFSNVAVEIRVKLSSRQNFHCHAGLECTDFKNLDEISTCGEINQKILEMVLKTVPQDVLERYYKFGQILTIGEDLGPFNAGPLWIWKSLTFEEIQKDEKSNIVVKSPTMRTPIDYSIKAAAGFHYCKILSPAYVVQWIYLDSLRKYRGLNQSNQIIEEEI